MVNSLRPSDDIMASDILLNINSHKGLFPVRHWGITWTDTDILAGIQVKF